MLSIFSVCELITFPQAQSRTFSQVCANDEIYEQSIFEFEDPWGVPDDSDDGYDNKKLITTQEENESCTYHLEVSPRLKERTLAFLNRIRWLTGYTKNITWDDASDEETCQCSFVRFASYGMGGLGHGEVDGRCMKQAPRWREGCQNSNLAGFNHKKMSNGVWNLYREEQINVAHRQLMLSQYLDKTSMCTTSRGKAKDVVINGNTVTENYADFFTMNIINSDARKEELPFIAAPPPGYIPYYMMPRVISLFSKDIQNPQTSEFKVYHNGQEITAARSMAINANYFNGYTFKLNLAQNFNHLTRQEGQWGSVYKPGSVFRFEATNNGNTYSWNTTLVDCAHDDSSKWPDPIPETQSKPEPENPSKPDTDTSSNSSMPENPSNTTTETEPTNNTKTEDPKPDNGDPSSQKSGLTGGQKAGIGIGVTLGVAAVAGAVVGGLVFAGAIGGGSAAGGGAAAAGASAAGASAAAV